MGIIDRIIKGEFTLIAEAGVNYYDIAVQEDITPLEAAKLMCMKAAEAGAHAIKFQSYKAETLTVKDSPSYWDTMEEAATSQYELFKRYDSFGENEYRQLAACCKEEGIDFCSTAFDLESADYLEPLMDIYKISSSDLTNLPFIKYQASKGKPMIVSVGASDLNEIKLAHDTIRAVNDLPLVFCHCVLEYPTPYEDANLRRICTLAQQFPDVLLGYSDHCKPDAHHDVLKTAYALGAHVIEKHYTLDKNLPGNDHYHAMDPEDIKKIIAGIGFVEEVLGEGALCHTVSEEAARRNARRSLVSACAIKQGERFTSDMLKFKRPGTGISPADISRVLESIAQCDIAEDSIITEEMICDQGATITQGI